MKKLLVLIMTMVLCIAICGCDGQEEPLGLGASTQEILNKISDKPYNELITYNSSSGQWHSFYMWWLKIPRPQRTHVLGPGGPTPTPDKVELYTEFSLPYHEKMDEITLINEEFPIECLRKNNDIIYSVHALEDDYMLYIVYEEYNNNQEKSLRAGKLRFVLPRNITLTDEAITSIKINESTLYNVGYSVDNTVKKGYGIVAPLSKFINSAEAIEYMRQKDLDGLCSLVALSTFHYTVNGNWYKIDYTLNSDEFTSTADVETLYIHQFSWNAFKVKSVEQIDAPPILEQDLPKQK
ncbi:MAG: hypothetical protein PUC05_03575 [Firmicutes bacterium]|nr:hypothetical protein [Bacillota bacterium]